MSRPPAPTDADVDLDDLLEDVLTPHGGRVVPTPRGVELPPPSVPPRRRLATRELRPSSGRLPTVTRDEHVVRGVVDECLSTLAGDDEPSATGRSSRRVPLAPLPSVSAPPSRASWPSGELPAPAAFAAAPGPRPAGPGDTAPHRRIFAAASQGTLAPQAIGEPTTGRFVTLEARRAREPRGPGLALVLAAAGVFCVAAMGVSVLVRAEARDAAKAEIAAQESASAAARPAPAAAQEPSRTLAFGEDEGLVFPAPSVEAPAPAKETPAPPAPTPPAAREATHDAPRAGAARGTATSSDAKAARARAKTSDAKASDAKPAKAAPARKAPTGTEPILTLGGSD